MKEIELTQNKVALVDDSVFERLSQFKWQAQKNCHTFYAQRGQYLPSGKRRIILMHREILGLSYGDGIEADHADGDGLHNFRSNLRRCSNQENHFNTRPQIGTSSKFKGVYWDRRDDKWQARIGVNGQRISLGRFTDEVDAAKAYDKAAGKYFGAFARVNFQPIQEPSHARTS